MNKIIALSAGLLLLLSMMGCSIKQEISKFDKNPERICIVKHKAVKEGVLEALNDGFNKHNITTQVVDGNYVLKHNMWQPTWYPEQVSTCDALGFYVANWTWDLAAYMYFANIWITTADGNEKLAQATYDASLGGGRMDKFISAREKILELVDEILSGQSADEGSVAAAQ